MYLENNIIDDFLTELLKHDRKTWFLSTLWVNFVISAHWFFFLSGVWCSCRAVRRACRACRAAPRHAAAGICRFTLHCSECGLDKFLQMKPPPRSPFCKFLATNNSALLEKSLKNPQKSYLAIFVDIAVSGRIYPCEITVPYQLETDFRTLLRSTVCQTG